MPKIKYAIFYIKYNSDILSVLTGKMVDLTRCDIIKGALKLSSYGCYRRKRQFAQQSTIIETHVCLQAVWSGLKYVTLFEKMNLNSSFKINIL